MPRAMLQFAGVCKQEGNKVGINKFKFSHTNTLRKSSEEKWLNTIPPGDKAATLSRVLDLVLGKVRFTPFPKVLYDNGVLFCDEQGHYQPVSTLAADVLFGLYVQHRPTDAEPNSNFYWSAVEAAVIKNIYKRPQGFEAEVFRLDGSGARLVPWGTFEAKLLLGGTTNEASQYTVQDETNAILYVPLSRQFAFDALLLPPANSQDPIVVIDVSIVDPYDPSRTAKYKSWKKEVSPLLKTKFPSHEVVYVAVWPEEYSSEMSQHRLKSGNFKKENKAALKSTYLLERREMKRLMVEIKYKEVA